MAFSFALNCTFDIYRGFNALNPYVPPNIPAALAGVQGHVRQHVRNGRFGVYIADNDQNPLYWTTIVNVPLGSDLRDPYNSQLVAPVIASGDTVMMYDYPIVGTCTAFLVVFVQNRSGYLRVYLDRCQPRYGVTCPSGIPTPCCANGWPATLYATLNVTSGTCDCIQGTFPLQWNGNTTSPVWAGATGACDVPADTVTMNFACVNSTTVQFTMECNQSGPIFFFGSGTDTNFSCPPALSATFSLSGPPNDVCCESSDFTVTVTQ